MYQNYKWHTHESKFIVAEHTHESSISTQGHQLQACSSLFLMAKVSNVCTCTYTNGVNFNPISVTLATLPTCWNAAVTRSNYKDRGRCSRSARTSILPHSYSANTGMTVTEARLPRSRARSTRRFALRARARYISMTTIPSLCTRLYCSDQSLAIAGASFMPSRLGHGLSLMLRVRVQLKYSRRITKSCISTRECMCQTN